MDGPVVETRMSLWKQVLLCGKCMFLQTPCDLWIFTIFPQFLCEMMISQRPASLDDEARVFRGWRQFGFSVASSPPTVHSFSVAFLELFEFS